MVFDLVQITLIKQDDAEVIYQSVVLQGARLSDPRIFESESELISVLNPILQAQTRRADVSGVMKFLETSGSFQFVKGANELDLTDEQAAHLGWESSKEQ